jgi:lysozyme family protein
VVKVVRSKVWCEEVRAELWSLWRSCTVTDPARFALPRLAALNGRAVYERIEEMTGVPWWWVAAIHQLESSGDFTRHLHNGDSLRRRTVRVPAGRPVAGEPPFDWVASAVDALTMPGKRLHQVSDWSIPHALWLLESFNGFGYRLYRHMPSPYLWAGTNHYMRGKYVADGKWSSTAVSKQAGCAGLLMALDIKEARA